ncbi:MAG: PEGA domain-containing protein [Gemmatimonadetes bacterium]|nr:PEGA domain-containing protein [Gemmatimonadota bacterium]
MEDHGTPVRISHFRIEHELGRDGLGFVFAAVDEQLERPVMLRLVRASAHYGAPDVPKVRARFRDAARRAALLSHPNLVTIYEFRPLTETDLVVMERVEGESLADMIARGARWTVLDAARLLTRLADALAVAHEAGLVHGRVGPKNVRIRPDGRIKLLDLGIPHVPEDELAPPPTQKDDVLALARLACGLLAAAPVGAVDRTLEALRDPSLARARYGFLAPMLIRAIAPVEEGGLETAGELRDALVVALDAATWRSTPEHGPADSRWATRMVGPDRFGAEERLPQDARSLQALAHHQPSTGSRRIVLPLDLAQRAHPGMETSVVELPPTAMPLPIAARRRFGARHLAGAVLLVMVLLGGWIGVRQLLAGTETQETAANDASVTTSPVNQDPVAVSSDTLAVVDADGTGIAAGADDTAAGPAAPVLTSMVRASPQGTRISIDDEPDSSWVDAVELAVPSGDTLVLIFSRDGYVTQTQRFTGSRMAVTLQPDSVVVLFRANMRADVLVLEGNRERRLGTTDFERALPTGSYRIVFRSPGQDDWTSDQAMTGAGRRYTVEKMDYVTLGSFVGQIVDGWARISVDGGPERETPARWNDLAVGAHIVRVMRQGFRTLVDTVVVRPGQTVTRQYTLQRAP